ncbi:hypothetical protein VPH35_113863 [Triticum aestivum]
MRHREIPRRPMRSWLRPCARGRLRSSTDGCLVLGRPCSCPTTTPPPRLQLWIQMASRPPPSLPSVSSFVHGLSARPIPRARRPTLELQRLSFSLFMSPPHLHLSLFFFLWSCREHAMSLAAAASTRTSSRSHHLRVRRPLKPVLPCVRHRHSLACLQADSAALDLVYSSRRQI